MRFFHLSVASVFGAGYFPVASGTFASALAIVPYLIIRENWLLHLGAIVILFFIGVWSSFAAEDILQEKDSHKIVIDEVVGYFIAVFLLPATWFYAIAAFFLFRLFDIWKPGVAGRSQSLPGGWGVMVDDVWAGLFANLCLQAIRLGNYWLG
ncbi:phosphatidylglycerophosphatase A [bacterium]|nr:phosphatidylglycerophosphatase A [bacterium]